MRRFLLLILALIMVICLAACNTMVDNKPKDTAVGNQAENILVDNHNKSRPELISVSFSGGNVKFFDDKGKDVPLADGLVVYEGWTIITGAKSWVQLEFGDDRVAYLAENAGMRVLRTANFEEDIEENTDLFLGYGRACFSIERKMATNEHFTVWTPGNSYSIKGTVFGLTVEGTSTYIEVLNGIVSQTTPDVWGQESSGQQTTNQWGQGEIGGTVYPGSGDAQPHNGSGITPESFDEIMDVSVLETGEVPDTWRSDLDSVMNDESLDQDTRHDAEVRYKDLDAMDKMGKLKPYKKMTDEEKEKRKKQALHEGPWYILVDDTVKSTVNVGDGVFPCRMRLFMYLSNPDRSTSPAGKYYGKAFILFENEVENSTFGGKKGLIGTVQVYFLNVEMDATLQGYSEESMYSNENSDYWREVAESENKSELARDPGVNGANYDPDEIQDEYAFFSLVKSRFTGIPTFDIGVANAPAQLNAFIKSRIPVVGSQDVDLHLLIRTLPFDNSLYSGETRVYVDLLDKDYAKFVTRPFEGRIISSTEASVDGTDDRIAKEFGEEYDKAVDEELKIAEAKGERGTGSNDQENQDIDNNIKQAESDRDKGQAERNGKDD